MSIILSLNGYNLNHSRHFISGDITIAAGLQQPVYFYRNVDQTIKDKSEPGKSTGYQPADKESKNQDTTHNSDAGNRGFEYHLVYFVHDSHLQWE